jgi:hypothetical protein
MDAQTAALIELIRLTECEESATIARQRALVEARKLVSWGALAVALGVDRGTVRGQYAAAVRALAQRTTPDNERSTSC